MIKITMLSFFASLLTLSAHAESGRYVCATDCDTYPNSHSCQGSAGPAQIAKTLNSLKCDTAKPFSISPQGETLTLICCVQR